MRFERDDPKCIFEVPDRPTVRQQLQYFGAIAGTDNEQFILRLWAGCVPLISEWNCETMPDYKASLDVLTRPSQTEVIIWAGLQVRAHMNALDDTDPNS